MTNGFECKLRERPLLLPRSCLRQLDALPPCVTRNNRLSYRLRTAAERPGGTPHLAEACPNLTCLTTPPEVHNQIRTDRPFHAPNRARSRRALEVRHPHKMHIVRWASGALHVTMLKARTDDADETRYIARQGERHMASGDKSVTQTECSKGTAIAWTHQSNQAKWHRASPP